MPLSTMFQLYRGDQLFWFIGGRPLFLYLDMTFSQVKFNTRAADKKDDVSFSIVNFPFLDVDVSLVPSLRWSHFSVRWFVSQLFVIMCLTSITITS